MMQLDSYSGKVQTNAVSESEWPPTIVICVGTTIALNRPCFAVMQNSMKRSSISLKLGFDGTSVMPHLLDSISMLSMQRMLGSASSLPNLSPD